VSKTERALENLLDYARSAKRAAAVAGHQGHSEADDSYHMGRSVAYQDIEELLVKMGVESS
jgi:hypothetical protein